MVELSLVVPLEALHHSSRGARASAAINEPLLP